MRATSPAPSSATRFSTCAPRGSRWRSSRPPASGTSASRTATASPRTSGRTRASGAPAGVLRLVRPRGAAGSSERGSRPRPLAALWPPGARHGEAVRAPGVGNRHRARGPCAGALPTARPAGPSGRFAVTRRRGGADANRSDRRQGDRKRGRPARIARRAGGSTARALRRSAGGGERGSRSWRGRQRASHAWWSATGRCGASFPMPSASCLLPSSGRTTSGLPIVVCPSRREGYGVVAREAMAHGRPVVASAVGGLLDAVEHERTGLLVPPGDAAALRAAIERLLADATLRAQARGGGARARRGALLVDGGHGRDARRL